MSDIWPGERWHQVLLMGLFFVAVSVGTTYAASGRWLIAIGILFALVVVEAIVILGVEHLQRRRRRRVPEA